jgi:hypothetical protein
LDQRPRISTENLPPGFSVEGEAIKYGDITFTTKRRHEYRQVKPVSHSNLPILMVPSLQEPSLPKPTDISLPAVLFRNVEFFLPPEINRVKSHVGSCKCVSLRNTQAFHRQSVLQPICWREEYLEADNFSIPASLDGEQKYLENPSRYFMQDVVEDTHVLGVPQPYLVSGCWPQRAWHPAFSWTREKAVLEVAYALHDGARSKEVATKYLTPPCTWRGDSPYWKEPSGQDELLHHTEPLYGMETLFRTSFVVHPTKEPRVPIYCAIDFDWRLPILINDFKDPTLLDQLIVHVMRPFYSMGQGRVICPLCLFKWHEGRYHPVLLSRSEYIRHYSDLHHHSSIVSGLFTSTLYHVRQYIATTVYHLSLPYGIGGDDQLDVSPICLPALQHFNIEYSSLLTDRFVDPELYPRKEHVAQPYSELDGLLDGELNLVGPGGSGAAGASGAEGPEVDGAAGAGGAKGAQCLPRQEEKMQASPGIQETCSETSRREEYERSNPLPRESIKIKTSKKHKHSKA